MLVNRLEELGGAEHGENDRDDRAGVAGRREHDGQAEERAGIRHLERSAGEDGADGLRTLHRDHTGVAQGDAERRAQELVDAELLGRGKAQKNRQEVEDAVGEE